VLAGHGSKVRCLAALEGGRLASGSDDGTIRVRNASAIHRVAACTSPFDFEKAAREGDVGQIFDAAVRTQFDEKVHASTEAWDASAAVVAQAHVFDAIATVVGEDEDSSKRVAVLAPRVLHLVEDDEFLPEWRRLGVTNQSIENLAPSPLFRAVLGAKYASGAIFVLYFEILLFVVLVALFVRVASLDVLRFSKWFAAEKVVEVVVAFVVIAYFSVREVSQMAAARALELHSPDNVDPEVLEGLAYCAFMIPRCFLLFAVDLLLSPVLLVLLALSRAGVDIEPCRKLLVECVARPIEHDPLTFLGLARSWRRDYWNWFDVGFLVSAWTAFALAIASGSRLSEDLAVVTTIFLGVKLCSLVRYTDESFARFILMIEKIVYDLRVFVVFFLIILLVFAFSSCPVCK